MALNFNLANIDAKRQLIDLERADCEDSLYVFLKSAWRIWDSAPWVDGWCIDAIAEHLQAVVDGEIRRLIINIPPRCAKPVSQSSIINCKDGLRRLSEIKIGDEVLTHKGRWRKVIAIHEQGFLPVLKLTTTRGREIVAAPDHPFLSVDGWLALEKIKGSDIVAIVPQYLPHEIRGEVVDDVTPAGITECRCLTVEEDESFVANGFAVHNSALCSVALPGWVWAQQRHTHTSGPGVSFLYASFREDLSRRDSVNCRKVIESKWYAERWGDRFSLLDDQNTKARFNNDKGGYRLITSVESKGATGDGANIIVLDDINSAKEVESEAVVESTTDWLDGTLGTRLNNQKLSAIIEIQQRLGENDITGHIIEKHGKDWVHVMLPMRYEPERSYFTSIGWKDPRTVAGELLWPERFGPDEVSALERWMGDWRACGQLQQRPEPRGGGVIKREWWLEWPGDVFPPIDFKVGLLDTAYTLDTMNDPSGMMVLGVFSSSQEQVGRIISPDQKERPIEIAAGDGRLSPKVMMMDAWTERYEFHELVKKTVETARKFKINLLLIENKAAGISVAQEIRRIYGNEQFSVQLMDPKSQDKFARLVSVQHIFQEGLVYAPDRPWVEDVIKQVGQFPRGKHDEYVDLISMGLRYLRDTGLIVRAIEFEAQMESLKVYRGHTEALYPV